MGQACLKPAIILGIDGPGFEAMRAGLVERVGAAPARTRRTPGIHQSHLSNPQGQREAGARRIAEGGATMHLEHADHEIARLLTPILERRTSRIVINAFAHPQEVSCSTIHGGPFPATTDSRFTSIDMTAIEEALKNDNRLGLWPLVDGQLTRDPIG